MTPQEQHRIHRDTTMSEARMRAISDARHRAWEREGSAVSLPSHPRTLSFWVSAILRGLIIGMMATLLLIAFLAWT